jgi:hypothetical protein
MGLRWRPALKTPPKTQKTIGNKGVVAQQKKRNAQEARYLTFYFPIFVKRLRELSIPHKTIPL